MILTMSLLTIIRELSVCLCIMPMNIYLFVFRSSTASCFMHFGLIWMSLDDRSGAHCILHFKSDLLQMIRTCLVYFPFHSFPPIERTNNDNLRWNRMAIVCACLPCVSINFARLIWIDFTICELQKRNFDLLRHRQDVDEDEILCKYLQEAERVVVVVIQIQSKYYQLRRAQANKKIQWIRRSDGIRLEVQKVNFHFQLIVLVCF